MTPSRDIITQADDFMSMFDAVPNPPPQIILDAFCEAMQATGRDLGEYTEEDWFRAFERMGYPPEDRLVLIEQVASWGVTDVDTFIDPASADLVAEATRAK